MVSSSGVLNQGFVNNIERSMQDLDDGGLDVAITELDIRICNNDRNEDFQEQAFRAVTEMALSQPNCRELLIWGLRDEDNWISVSTTGFFGPCDDPVIVEGNYEPKPAYNGVAAALTALPDRDAFGFTDLNPGNGAPADCGGTGSLDPSITSVFGPTNVSPGEQVTVSVGYIATGDQDVFVVFQLDSDPWTFYTETVTDVTAGSGTIDVVLNIPANTPPGNFSYQYQTFITPNGGSYDTRFSDLAQTNVTVLGEGGPQMIVSIEAPEVVGRGDTAVVNVVYQAGEDQQVVVWFQLDETPFTTYQEFRVDVAAGDGELVAKLFIPADVPLAVNEYQFQTLLVPTGGNWAQRISNIALTDVDVVMGTGVDDGAFGGLSLRAYPNPTGGLLNVELPAGSSRTEYEVYSLVGQQVSKGIIGGGTSRGRINLDGLPSGMYLLLFQRDGMTGRVRVRKQ